MLMTKLWFVCRFNYEKRIVVVVFIIMRRRFAVSPLDTCTILQAPPCTVSAMYVPGYVPLSLSLCVERERGRYDTSLCPRQRIVLYIHMYCTIILIHMYWYIRWACVWVRG